MKPPVVVAVSGVVKVHWHFGRSSRNSLNIRCYCLFEVFWLSSMALLFFSVKATLAWQDLHGAKRKPQLLLLVSRLRQTSSISSPGSAGSPSLALFLSEKWKVDLVITLRCLVLTLWTSPTILSVIKTLLHASVVVCLLFSCVKGECSWKIGIN